MAACGVLVLPGCSRLNPTASAERPMPAMAAVAPQPADPVIAFAATARPGSEAVLAEPQTGQRSRVRLLRAYNAASGRECREVLIGAGANERSRLVCQAEGPGSDGQWAEARPLLRGGGTLRP